MPTRIRVHHWGTAVGQRRICHFRKLHFAGWLEHQQQTAIAATRQEPNFANLRKAAIFLLENQDQRALLYLHRAKNKAPTLEEQAEIEKLFEAAKST
jgi:hypothetical protein